MGEGVPRRKQGERLRACCGCQVPVPRPRGTGIRPVPVRGGIGGSLISRFGGSSKQRVNNTIVRAKKGRIQTRNNSQPSRRPPGMCILKRRHGAVTCARGGSAGRSPSTAGAGRPGPPSLQIPRPGFCLTPPPPSPPGEEEPGRHPPTQSRGYPGGGVPWGPKMDLRE